MQRSSKSKPPRCPKMPPRHFRMALRHPQMHPSHQHWFTQFWGLSSIGTFLFTRLLYAILSYIYFLPKPLNLVPMVSSLASNALGSTSTVQPLASTNLQSRRAFRSLAKTDKRKSARPLPHTPSPIPGGFLEIGLPLERDGHFWTPKVFGSDPTTWPPKYPQMTPA